jgi:hypothetical protein
MTLFVSVLSVSEPTAWQTAFGVQATAESETDIDPAGSGVGPSRQVLPFQSSASVKVPAPWAYVPTAAQELDPEQDTLDSELVVVPVGTGTLSRAQLVPSQFSANAVVPDVVA